MGLESLVKPLVILTIILVLFSIIMAFLGFDGTFVVDWIGGRIGDFFVTIGTWLVNAVTTVWNAITPW